MSVYIYLGPMFAGKTSKLLSLYRASEESKIILSPKLDTRPNKGFIKNHDGSCENSLTLETYKTVRNIKSKQHLFIDEIQFISEGLLNYLHRLGKKKEIFMFGLNLDWTGAVFPNVEKIVDKTENVFYLNGKCAWCEEPSWYSAKKKQVGEIIEVGGENLYFPLCRKCFYKHRKNK